MGGGGGEKACLSAWPIDIRLKSAAQCHLPFLSATITLAWAHTQSVQIQRGGSYSGTCQLWALGLVPVGQLSNTPAVLVHWSPGAGPALSIYPLVVSAHHSDKSTGHLVALTYIFFFYSPHSLKEKYAFIFHEDYSKMYCSCSHEN